MRFRLRRSLVERIKDGDEVDVVASARNRGETRGTRSKLEFALGER